MVLDPCSVLIGLVVRSVRVSPLRVLSLATDISSSSLYILLSVISTLMELASDDGSFHYFDPFRKLSHKINFTQNYFTI